MNKLEEYKQKLWEEKSFIDSGESFTEGFDAAIALDLPTKFAEWKDEHCDYVCDTSKQDDEWGWETDIEELKGLYTNKELYQYWIDNIYKPE